METFQRALAEGEAEQRGVTSPDHLKKSRIRRAITRRLAETVAEQRLLWHLRRQPSARLIYADDLTPATACAASRALLVADRDRHRRWCVIDALLTVATTPLALVPGPNVLAYLFLFRAVGHFLSMRGAQHGLTTMAWVAVASPHLTALRAALPLPGDQRSRRVDEIASALGLDRLSLFVAGIANGAP
ncbi:MAG: hypothetical protein ABI652_05985 [Acidobacteriota bacterium]